MAAGGARGNEGATARAHLERLAAEPRPAGGDAERRARQYCIGVLRTLGFTAAERTFEYSTLPGRWGTPLGGALSFVAIVGAALLGARGRGGLGLTLLVVSGAVALVAGAWLARRGVLASGVLRAHSVNLEATRGPAEPRLWLVAHLDSKSQPVPIGTRAVGVTASGIAWIVAVALSVGQLSGEDVAGWWTAIGVLGALAALPVVASVVGARSPGALDDASGVATVLLAAAHLPADTPVGVLLTSAEELGLAGARAWAAARESASGVALNCDGVDDVGRVTCMYTRRAPERLIGALTRAASSAGAPVPRVLRLIPGLLTDGVALADAGWEVITVSRGTLHTLGRIHTPRDSLDALRGTGVAETARVMARAVEMLLLEESTG